MTPVISFVRGDAADPTITLPAYTTAGAAGADVRANLALTDRAAGVRVPPLGRCLVPTGLHANIPDGFEIQVRPRSGLALKHGLTLLNTPGTIDSDYRGEIGVILINLSDADYVVTHGDRIAQLVVAPVVQAVFREADQLSNTTRNDAGFGSTGVS